MRRIFWLGTLLGVVALPVLAADEEPTLRGKKASEWAAQLQGKKFDAENVKLAQFVLGNTVGGRPDALRQSSQVRRVGLVALQVIGPDKYPPMLQVLVTALQNDADDEIRAGVASALSGMAEKVEKGRFATAREAITVALRRDPSPRVREAAATALGKLEAEDARPAVLVLAGALKDTDPAVRGAAADTLRRLGKDAAEAAPALVVLLKDTGSEELTRTQAALALGRIGPPEAVQAGAVAALKEVILSADTPNDLRTASIRSVGFFGKDAADVAPAVATFLVLKKAPTDLRRLAAEVLDQLGPESRPAVKELRQALKDDDKFVRGLALHALAGLARDLNAEDRGQAIQGFLEGLSDTSLDVRIAAINACAHVGPELLGDSLKPVRDRLTALTRDPQKDIAEAARVALGKLKAP
jgi:HEAT repeat protein